MMRSLAAILCALNLAAFSLVPAQAEESAVPKSDSSTETKAPGKKSVPKSPSASRGGIGGYFSKIPKNVPAFLAGVVVGTPVALVRMSKREIVTATRELVGETDNPLILGAGGVLGVPAGLMSGALYGLYAGTADSWVNADDNPYSRDSFSLGDMK